MDDLVKRLRAGNNGQELEAADRIEQLEAENVALREDAAAGWDKCEERRVESAALELALTQSQDIIDLWINTSSEQYQTIVETQEALTQSRAETAAAVEMLNDADHQYNRRTNDMIARHAAAQAKSRAETAAAYERAADVMKRAYEVATKSEELACSAISRAHAAIRALATSDQSAALDKLIAEAVKPYVEALAWYGEQSRLARLIHSEGDTGRNALQADGGKRAKAILAAIKGDKA